MSSWVLNTLLAVLFLGVLVFLAVRFYISRKNRNLDYLISKELESEVIEDEEDNFEEIAENMIDLMADSAAAKKEEIIEGVTGKTFSNVSQKIRELAGGVSRNVSYLKNLQSRTADFFRNKKEVFKK